MQWHWGNIGSAVAGLSALAIALAALVRGPGFIRDRRANEQEQKKLAAQQTETLRAERRRKLSGWSSTGINTYKVTLVTSEAERDVALKAVSNDGPSEYVILRVLGGPGGVESLRRLLLDDPYLARRPTVEECETLKAGLEALGIPRAATGTTPA